jgi:protein TonB
MPTRERVRRLVAGATMAVVGSIATLVAVHALADAAAAAAAPTTIAQVEFAVLPVPPPPRAKKPRPKRQPSSTPRATGAKAAPPSLARSLAGFELDGAGRGEPIALADGDLDDATRGDTSDVVMTEETVDEAPVALETPKPVHPARARRDGVEGRVTLSILIGTDGRVADARVLEATPTGVFDDAATDAIRAWRFSPARYQGAAVRTWRRITIVFELG